MFVVLPTAYRQSVPPELASLAGSACQLPPRLVNPDQLLLPWGRLTVYSAPAELRAKMWIVPLASWTRAGVPMRSLPGLLRLAQPDQVAEPFGRSSTMRFPPATAADQMK